jgi:DinB family protein
MVWPPMLRRSCQTGGMDELVRRIRDAGAALLGLRGALVAGEPWPLSDDWGHTPEAEWGPREVLGHVNEMLPYWTDQLELVLAGDPTTPVPFGRVATDQSRLDRIDADRAKPVAVLLDEIGGGLDRVLSFLGGLSPADAERLGAHPTRGTITIRESAERFFATHLEEHVDQLRRTLDRPATA